VQPTWVALSADVQTLGKPGLGCDFVHISAYLRRYQVAQSQKYFSLGCPAGRVRVARDHRKSRSFEEKLDAKGLRGLEHKSPSQNSNDNHREAHVFQRWEITDVNSIDLVRQRGGRRSIPRVLSVHDMRLVLGELTEPYHTMVLIAACLGLRAS
jgi:hypothetical protein